MLIIERYIGFSMSTNFFLVDIEKIACYTVHELGKAIGFFQKEECSRTSLFFVFIFQYSY